MPKKQAQEPTNIKELTDLVSKAVKLKERIDKYNDAITPVKEDLKKLLEQTIPDAMGDELDNFKVKRLHKRVHLKPGIFTHNPVNKKEELHKWFRKRRLGSLVVEAVNARTLTRFILEQMDRQNNGLKYALPPNSVVKVTPNLKAVITKTN